MRPLDGHFNKGVITPQWEQTDREIFFEPELILLQQGKFTEL